MRSKLPWFGRWLTPAGIVATLIGLAWDASLHRLDPSLAAREGIFAPENPGHLFLGGGIACAAAGVTASLAGLGLRNSHPAARLRALAGAGGLAALAMLSFGLALGSDSALNGHGDGAHGDEAVAQSAGEDGDDHVHASEDAAAVASAVKVGVTHDHGEAVVISADELEAAEALVASVRQGTARLEDFASARAEGYVQITGGRSGLAHYHNQAYYTDGRILDPERPEELMYYRLPSGELKLVGVMFLMPPGEAGPRVGGPLTAWHAHDNLCYSTKTGLIVALTDAEGQCPAGTVYRGMTPEMMHVWLVANPGGVFGDDMDPATLASMFAARP